MSQPLIVIVGPTAAGKTSLSLTLAAHCQGEVISADSRQIYRGLDIGTAKVTAAEMGTIPHHLIDIVDVADTYTAHDFVHDATLAITDIVSRDAVPIVVGGTFFYVDSLLGRITHAGVPPNTALRDELASYTLPALQTRLAAVDQAALARIDQHNPRRLMRAIEIAEAGTATVPTRPTVAYQPYLIGLSIPKDVLRERFRMRALAWLQAGFLDEVASLLSTGITPARLSEIGFEYALGTALLQGNLTETAFIQRFIEKNWQYAKRQLTWLQRDPTIHWHDALTLDTAAIIVDVTLWLAQQKAG